MLGGHWIPPSPTLILGLVLKWDVFGRQFPLLGFAVLVAVMIVVKHRGNLARLRAGTEHRIGKKEESAE